VDSGSCDARLSSRWRRVERKGIGQCPAGDDQATRAFLLQCADDIATALAGNALPTCDGSPAGAHLGPRATGGHDRDRPRPLLAARPHRLALSRPEQPRR
jgi:hypothetical protein